MEEDRRVDVRLSRGIRFNGQTLLNDVRIGMGLMLGNYLPLFGEDSLHESIEEGRPEKELDG